MQRWREKESPGEMRRCAAKIRNPRTDLYHSFVHGSVLAEEILHPEEVGGGSMARNDSYSHRAGKCHLTRKTSLLHGW